MIPYFSRHFAAVSLTLIDDFSGPLPSVISGNQKISLLTSLELRKLNFYLQIEWQVGYIMK